MPGLLRVQYDKDDLEYVGMPARSPGTPDAYGALRGRRPGLQKAGQEGGPHDPPPENRETYALIRTGNNAGMFQLESPGQMHLSRRLKPRRFSDLVAQISLFRPGPVRGDL